MSNPAFPEHTKSRGSSMSGILTMFGMIMVALVVFGLARVMLESAGDRREGAARQHEAVGLTLPGLRVQPVDDLKRNVTLEDVQGKVLLVNFWGTWCPPCREELPHMEELYQAHRDNDAFRMIAVSGGQNALDEEPTELAVETRGFLEHFDYQLPAYLDEGAATRRMLLDPRYLGDLAYPTTLITDHEGKIRGVWIGYMPGYEQEMRDLVDELLAES